MATIRFKREASYDLTWDVFEGDSYSGELAFGTGADAGWWFTSSDGSIRWDLGPNVARAKRTLRALYRKPCG